MFHADVAKSGAGEQIFKVGRIGKREGQLNDGSLIREKATEHIGKNAPHGRAVGRGDDANPHSTPITDHTSKLHQPEAGIWKELQAELAYDGVKTGVCERQCLPIRSDRQKRRFV